MSFDRQHHLEHARDRTVVHVGDGSSLVVTSAPGYVTFVDGMHNGRWQTITIDPGDLDALIGVLEDAKGDADVPQREVRIAFWMPREVAETQLVALRKELEGA